MQGPEPEAAFLQFCRLRLQDFAAVLAGKVVQSLQSVLSGTGDLLVDLNRELHVLVAQYDDGGDTQPKAAPALFGQLRKLVSEQVENGIAAQGAVLDETLTKQILVPAGGLLKAFTAGGDVRLKLIAALEAESRKLIMRQLESLDIAAVLAEGAAIDRQLAADGGRSLSRLVHAGKARRRKSASCVCYPKNRKRRAIRNSGETACRIRRLSKYRRSSTPPAPICCCASKSDRSA